MQKINNISELREIQMCVMDSIHNFCMAHSLTYFISSGTLLGAVRHGGYIPWDDDIDIYMPRDSYDIFVKTFNTQNENVRYREIDIYNTPGYYYSFAKVIDTRTLVKETTDIGVMNLGVWVDVFPIDRIPDYKLLRTLLAKVRGHWLYKIRIKEKIEGTSLQDKIIKRCYPSSKFIIKSYYWFANLISGKDKFSHISEVGATSFEKIIKKEWLKTMVDIKFENRIYKTMNGYKEYLSTFYGDYMKLPPLDQRKRHNIESYYID